MNFGNPDDAKNAQECAKMFCSTVTRVLTYATKQITDSECADILEEIKMKFISARDAVCTPEYLTEKIGATIIKWRTKIMEYDTDFFMTMNIANLFGGENAPELNDVTRSKFYKSTTSEMRTIVFDALNLMLILYAKFRVHTQSK